MNEGESHEQEYIPGKEVKGFFGILITNPYILERVRLADTEKFVQNSVYTKKFSDKEKDSLIKALETTFTRRPQPGIEENPIAFLAKNFLMAMNAEKIVADLLNELGFGDKPFTHES